VSLCHESEHLPLAGRELGERPCVASVGDEAGDDGGVDDALSVSDAPERVGQRADLRYAVLQEVARAFRELLDERHRIARFQIVREHQDADIGIAAADLASGDEPFVGVARRHLDVGDGHVRPPGFDEAQQSRRVLGGPGDLEAGLYEQPGETFAQERLVICEHYAHGSLTRTWVLPVGVFSTASSSLSAPTLSSTSIRSGGAPVRTSTTS
jgi:hypothetical protein